MNFAFLCLVIAQCVFLSNVDAVYNKDVTCIIDENKDPLCELTARPKRRDLLLNENPSHDPYIPRSSALLFSCSTEECQPFLLYSLTQLASPELALRSCFQSNDSNYTCEIIRFHYLKNIDKLLFLSKNMRDKSFYMVDCLIYTDGGRVCHKKDNVNSYSKLVDTGTIARPDEPSVLSQDEFICEESTDKEVNCDLNTFIPFEGGLKLKESVKYGDNVLLKSGSYVTQLTRVCVGDAWCGYSGRISQTRRNFAYSPPGGKVYRCYYAKRQQICKEWYSNDREIYNERGWLST